MSDVIALLSEFCTVKSGCKILHRVPCFFIKQGEILHHLGKDVAKTQNRNKDSPQLFVRG